MLLPVLATLVALTGAAVGLWLTSATRGTRMAIPFSGGVLLGVSAFGLLPELIGTIGWSGSLLLFGAGYLLLLAVNRYVYPICPSCSHDHDHEACAMPLHGFAAPLISATALHALLDGWTIVATQGASPAAAIRMTVPLAIILHKVPEGIALGAILRVSVPSRLMAFSWCMVAQMATILGGAAGLAVVPNLNASWTTYPLALAGGFFFFVGFHAIHGEWRRGGAAPVFMPALTGAAGAAVLQHGVRVFFR